MDLDYDFEDPLLEYVSFYHTGGTKFFVSQYLLDKLEQQRHYLSPTEYFQFNQNAFCREQAVSTLKSFINVNFAGFWQNDECTWMSDTMLSGCATYYATRPEQPQDEMLHESTSIIVVIANRFHEIHGIGTSTATMIQRPVDLLLEEREWTPVQKYVRPDRE